MSRLFEFLFKYRPAVFARGELALGSPRLVIVLLLLAAVIAAPAVLSYATVRGRSTRRDRWVLGGLRGAAILVLLVCLFRPMLVLSAAVPQRNYVGVLIDDSRSMRIADDDGRSRADWVRRHLAGPDSALLHALRERFALRFFRVGGRAGAERVAAPDDLTFDAAETRLGDAVEAASRELASVPVSGLVLLSDGADNSRAAVGDELLSLRARSVPVFTVGLGRARFGRDVEVRRVEAPRTTLAGSAVAMDVFVRQRGFAAGTRVPLVVEDSGHVVSTQEIALPADGDVAPVRVRVAGLATGPRTITVRIPLQPDEQVAGNNAQQALIVVRGGREKILYVEGEPRYEMRFVRQAVADDSALQLVTLQRTDDDKFLRLDVDGPSELASGFPRTRAELFRYRAIVLGSIEASFFTRDQLQMLADFVSVRGGGLLVLGGRRALAEGGYAGTPLAEALPVVVEGDAVPDSLTTAVELEPRLTPAGASQEVTQLAPTESASVARWRTLPHVTSVNRVRRLRPGAVALATGVARTSAGGVKAGDEQPLLAWQRYGRGVVAALPIQDSWLWRMSAEVAPDDRTFEIFWRQLLRWLVRDVPNRVTAVVADQAAPDASLPLRAEVADSDFARRNDAHVVAHVTAPDGTTRDVPVDWSVERDGEYRSTLSLGAPGMYRVVVEETGAGSSASADTAYVRVGESNAEYVDAEMRAPLLERMARETGGRFYTPATVASLPEDLTLGARGVTAVRQMDLWDMPAVFLLLVTLVTGEWAYRKMRGLV